MSRAHAKEGREKTERRKKKGNVVALSNRSPPSLFPYTFFSSRPMAIKAGSYQKRKGGGRMERLSPSRYTSMRDMRSRKRFFNGERDNGLGLRSNSLYQAKNSILTKIFEFQRGK